MDQLKPYEFLHISDLHFGRIHDHVLSDLEKYLTAHQDSLDLVIITGDLTQRARTHQFLNAKEFISRFQVPFFIVPGNHDVPLYNLFRRFFMPYSKYRKTMDNLTVDFYEDDRIAVFGLWTVARFKVQEGRFDFSQIRKLEKKFSQIPKEKIKIIACHHPIERMQDRGVERLIDLHPHFILWGHDHQSLARYYDVDQKKLPLLLASGTSISSRTRSEANSFNRVRVFQDHIDVQVWLHSEEEERGFIFSHSTEFEMKLQKSGASVAEA